MAEIGQASPEARQPWGIWATLGWAALAIVLSWIAGVAVAVGMRPESLMGGVDLLKDGLLLSLTNTVSNAIQIAVLAWAARAAEWPIGDYLALVTPKGRDTVVAFTVLIPFLLAFDALTYLIGRDVVTPFQIDTYTSAAAVGALPLLWFALVIAAPAAEEVIFRGFLFRGWVRSGRSAIPGILVITVLFAIVHLQYDWFGIVQVFLIGLILAWARWRSGSVLLTIAMHALTNLWATLETMVKVDWLS